VLSISRVLGRVSRLGCGGGKAWRLETKAWTYECADCDSTLEEAVMSEPVSGNPHSLVTGKNTGKLAGPTIRAFLIL